MKNIYLLHLPRYYVVGLASEARSTLSLLSEPSFSLLDDKLRILAALKKAWGDRVTTVFPRQGQFANDPKVVAATASVL
jgi:hypothetical protein